jgi:hypothetical protein
MTPKRLEGAIGLPKPSADIGSGQVAAPGESGLTTRAKAVT